jgi:Fe-S oxidoreductase/nitrate reductase gamma subunit
MVPTRELYWNISCHGLMYPLLLIALTVFFYGFYRRYRFWRIGQADTRPKLVLKRLKAVLIYVLAHKKILKDSYAGIMHLAVFWGFLILFIGTTVVAAQEHLKLPLLFGNFYLGFSLILDIFGLIALCGILMAACRRYILKPERLDNRSDDLISLLIIFLILVSGFFLEGLRIAGTGDPWADWSPVGKFFSLFAANLSLKNITFLYQIFWWGHLLLVLGFIAYLPYGKLLHIITSPLNIYFRTLEKKEVLPFIDFANEERESYGLEKLEDFTWRQLLAADACTRCGRCQDNCPAYLTPKPISPKQVVQAIKQNFSAAGYKLTLREGMLKAHTAKETVATEKAVLSLWDNGTIKDSVWSCTTCRACEEECPVFVEHIERTIELRRNSVLTQDEYPQELMLAYRNLENNSNPWGIGWIERSKWAENINLEILDEKKEVEYLYWTGCAGSFDYRNKKVSIALAKLLQLAGIEFGILGTEEKCCGDVARRTGNEYLFQQLAQENIETLQRYNFKKIITACPHCYNSLKHDYPQLGGSFEVIHHTEILSDLIKKGKLHLTKKDAAITYHDSCYLGRYNDIYQPPREILKNIPGLKLLEPKRNKERSFCCGAGGGRMWMEETSGPRINQNRAEDILQTGAKLAATACPYCLTMLEDGLKALNIENIKALDISEILLEALSTGVNGEEKK